MKTLKKLVQRKKPTEINIHSIERGDTVVYADGVRGVVDFITDELDANLYKVWTDVSQRQCNDEGICFGDETQNIVEIIFCETYIEKIAKVADQLAEALKEADIASDYMGPEARTGLHNALAEYKKLCEEVG